MHEGYRNPLLQCVGQSHRAKEGEAPGCPGAEGVGSVSIPFSVEDRTVGMDIRRAKSANTRSDSARASGLGARKTAK